MTRQTLPIAALVLGAAATLAAVPAMAQVDGRAARGLVFSERGRSVQVADLDWITPDVRKATEQYGAQFPYYGAFAVSPGDPASTGSAVAVGNYHSAAAAQTAALNGCNAKRTSGGPCVIAATILPRGYQARALTLSVDATTALKKGYQRLQAPKALAISPATGAFGIERGDGGRAIALCNAEARKRGAADCVVAVAE